MAAINVHPRSVLPDAETDTLFRGGEPVSLGHRAVALLRVLETSDLVERLKALDVSFDNARQ